MSDRADLPNLEAIRERERKATPGPWTNEGGDIGTDAPVMPPPHTGMGAVLFQEDWATVDDCDFVANARTDIPALLAHIDALTAALKPVVAEAKERADFEHDSWNPEAHVELTLTIAEVRALAACLPKNKKV